MMVGDSIPVVVIADDFTGAAEIAAIAAEFGFAARVCRGSAARDALRLDVPGGHAVAVDTDTRCVAAVEAARVVSTLPPVPGRAWVYKKTDSLLRGNPGAEIEALLRVMGRRRALLLPQNPSKKRIIRGGHYYVDGVPLHETSFNADPEHPRLFSAVDRLLAPTPVTLVEPGEALIGEGIFVGNAATLEDVAAYADGVGADDLAAGGADFFRALLSRHFSHCGPLVRELDPPGMLRLVVSGSASGYSRQTVQTWRERNLPVHPVTCAVSEVMDSLERRHLAIVAIMGPLEPALSMELRMKLSTLVNQVVTHPAIAMRPLHLFMEGGATAAAVADTVGWQAFEIRGMPAPGVVTLGPVGAMMVRMTIKPGSYPWPAGPIESW